MDLKSPQSSPGQFINESLTTGVTMVTTALINNGGYSCDMKSELLV